MNFHFEGLDVPIALPDEYLSVVQYERLQRFLHQHAGEPEDFRFVRECLADLLGDPGFMGRTDHLPMNLHNMKQWEGINNHLAALLTGSGKVGDDITDGVVSGPLPETPQENEGTPTPTPESADVRT